MDEGKVLLQQVSYLEYSQSIHSIMSLFDGIKMSLSWRWLGKLWRNSPWQWAKIKQTSNRAGHICVNLPPAGPTFPTLPISVSSSSAGSSSTEDGSTPVEPRNWVYFCCHPNTKLNSIALYTHPKGIAVPILIFQGQDPWIKLDMVITHFAEEDIQILAMACYHPQYDDTRVDMLLPGAG